MATPLICEACGDLRYVTIRYVRARGETVERPLCRQHAQEVWNALPHPLKETASILGKLSVS